ncbi:hypothetical protein PM082_021370, partial [Marasmius tenuissimus]
TINFAKPPPCPVRDRNRLLRRHSDCKRERDTTEFDSSSPPPPAATLSFRRVRPTGGYWCSIFRRRGGIREQDVSIGIEAPEVVLRHVDLERFFPVPGLPGSDTDASVLSL